MRIFIEPLDVWLFRDGKPFSAGEDHLAETFFPPTPLTLQGAVRTKILAEQGVDFTAYKREDPALSYLFKEIGTPKEDDFGKLELKGPFVAREKEGEIEEFYPLPFDVLKESEKEAHFLLKPKENKLQISSNIKTSFLWSPAQKFLKRKKGLLFLPLEQLMLYLKGRLPEKIIEEEDFFEKEPRLGIGMNKEKRISEEGKLYISQFIRMKRGAGLTLDIEGTNLFPEKGYLSLGGERRGAISRKVRERKLKYEEIIKHVRENRRFKLYLLTPAIFKKGWLPNFIEKGEFSGLKFKLISAAVGKPLYFGGWNVAQNIPKPIRKGVPAGSVYFLKLTEGEVEELFEAFWFKSISEFYPQTGLGVTLIGGWEYV